MSALHDQKPIELAAESVAGEGGDVARSTAPPWPGLEMRHLAALAAVARQGSFRSAAESLGYVQSAVSQQVARLERIVGTRLVDRRRGAPNVTLTDAGALLARHIAEIMACLDSADADIDAIRAGRVGTLSVGVYESVATRLMPPILSAMAAQLPEVEVRMVESRTADGLAQRIEGGEVDLAFGNLPLPRGPFDFVPVLDDPYVLLVPACWPLAAVSGTPPAEELIGMPLIASRQDGLPATVEAMLHERGIEPRYVFRSESNTAVQALVAAEIGAAIVPRLAANPADPQTALLTLDGLVPPRVIALYWHHKRQRTPARAAFVKLALTPGLLPTLSSRARTDGIAHEPRRSSLRAD